LGKKRKGTSSKAKTKAKNKEILSIIDKITKLTYTRATDDVWGAIQFEGLDDEFDLYDQKDWDYAVLNVSPAEKKGLMNLETYYLEKWNNIDFILKETYNLEYIVMIDYDIGRIIVAKPHDWSE